jgi:hypothetical protein
MSRPGVVSVSRAPPAQSAAFGYQLMDAYKHDRGITSATVPYLCRLSESEGTQARIRAARGCLVHALFWRYADLLKSCR